MYWSAVVRFSNKPEQTVELTSEKVDFIILRKIDVMLSIMPLAVMAPPKHIAQRISHIVLSIPDIPRVAIKSFTKALPDSRFVLPVIIATVPSKSGDIPLPNSAIVCGCATKAVIVA